MLLRVRFCASSAHKRGTSAICIGRADARASSCRFSKYDVCHSLEMVQWQKYLRIFDVIYVFRKTDASAPFESKKLGERNAIKNRQWSQYWLFEIFFLQRHTYEKRWFYSAFKNPPQANTLCTFCQQGNTKELRKSCEITRGLRKIWETKLFPQKAETEHANFCFQICRKWIAKIFPLRFLTFRTPRRIFPTSLG